MIRIIFRYLSDYFTWVACRNHPRGNTFCHNAACPNDRIMAYRYARQNRDISSQPDVVLNCNRPAGFYHIIFFIVPIDRWQLDELIQIDNIMT